MRGLRLEKALTVRRRRAALVGAVVLTADQITKLWARTALADGGVEVIPGFLRFHLGENPGSAFSLFQGLGPLLGLAAAAASVFILVIVERAGARLEVAGLSLILGGAVGNLADRVMKGPWLTGTVTDFIDFSFWPNFNLADSAITLGVAGMLWAARRGG